MAPSRVVRGLAALRRPPVRAVVTVGMFDGVHLGHQRLVLAAVRLARRIRGTSIAMTFDPDPQAVLDPARTPPALLPLTARVERLQALGLDLVWIIPFTPRFARVTAETFVRRILIGRLRAVALVVGEGFAFGSGRRGDARLLKALGPRSGMRVIWVPAVRYRGARVSSSRIRSLIAAGRLALARKLLGRPLTLYGMVIRGAGRGRRLGFPTANLRVHGQLVPPRGVYAVRVERMRRPGRWPGVMNLGMRPTFGAGPPICEVHLLGFSGSLRGRPLAVSVLARLRGERTFRSPHALASQIGRDIAHAERVFRRPS